MDPLPFPLAPDAEDRAGIVFFQALKLPPDQRPAFLAVACTEDPVLRAEVDGLLRDHEKAGHFLDGPSFVPAELAPGLAGLHSDQAGETIGPYKLLQQIGEGGFGVVWMAEQEKPVRRRVALKIIKPGMDTKEVIARFDQERQALAMMDHPNIARVFDAGATALGRPFFVMELVRGVRITEYCDQVNLPTVERLRLFIAVCQAVQHAHQKGIIHRDLKPSNILVTLHDGVPVPKVIDFGIAKATQQQRLTDLTLYTQFEQMMGTPLYMSPEQMEMSGLDIDTRSDIYSLGVLLYELLVGRTPFDPEALMKRGIEEIRRVVREQEPPKPSTFVSTMALDLRTTVARQRQTDGAKLVGQIRGDLDWIVMKALEKDRSRRYETATGLAQDIQRHLLGEPVKARPATQFYRFRRFAKRNKVVFAAGAGVAAALVAGLTASTWMFLKERQARERAVAAEAAQSEASRKVETEAAKSRQVARFLKEMLKGVGPSVALGRDNTMLLEIIKKTEDRLSTDLEEQPEIEAELRQTLGAVYEELGHYEQAEEMDRRALLLRTKVYGSDHPGVTDLLNQLGTVLLRQKKFADAETIYREQLKGYRNLTEEGNVKEAGALGNLSAVLAAQGKTTEAEKFGRESLAMHRHLLPHQNRDLATAIHNMAVMLTDNGRLDEAETLHRESLGIFKSIFGSEHPSVAGCLQGLALLMGKKGQLADGVVLQREALAMQRKLLGNQHPDVVSALNELATMLVSQGNLDEAEALHREALGIVEQFIGMKGWEFEKTLNRLTGVLNQKGRPAEAEAMHREALALRRKVLGNNHPDVAKSLNTLARLLSAQGQLTEAETLFRELLENQTKQLGPEHADIGVTLNELALVLSGLNKKAESETMFREALVMLRKFLGNENQNVGTTLSNLGDVVYDQGKLPEAENVWEEAFRVRQKVLGPNDPATVASLTKLGELLLEEDKLADAAALFREATALGVASGGETLVGRALSQLPEILYRIGKFADAEALYRETYEKRLSHLAADSEELNLSKASLARCLSDWAWSERVAELQKGSQSSGNLARAREAVDLLRECLVIRLRGSRAGHWRTSDVQSRLGGALVAVAATDPASTGEARGLALTEAEFLLLKGHEAMEQIPSIDPKYRRDSLVRLVRLYEVWDQPEKAVPWQGKLDSFEQSNPERSKEDRKGK